MRASELLAARVTDADGRDLGPVRDVRVRTVGDSWEITAIVVGGGRLAGVAHALGVAEGRVRGPRVLLALCADAVREARRVPADAVAEWGPGELRLSLARDDLRPLREDP